MKKLILLLVITFVLGNANAQKIKATEVPALVKKAFKKQYAAVQSVKWEKEDTGYEAEFEINKTETSVVYDAAGNLLETETGIAVNTLPQNALTYLAKKFPGKKVKEAARIINVAGLVRFEAEVGGKDYLFDADGNPIAG